MIELSMKALGVYGITVIVVSGYIFQPFRAWFQKKTPFLLFDGSHPITCRLCIGVWVTIILCGAWKELPDLVRMILAINGLSYFLVTQERLG